MSNSNSNIERLRTNEELQRVLDMVLNKMKEQGHASYNVLNEGWDGCDRYRCVYRSEEGYCCAVGALITDENYDAEKLENHTIKHVNVKDAVFASLDFVKNRLDTESTDDLVLMLNLLQRSHDNTTNLHNMERIVNQVATFFEVFMDEVRSNLLSEHRLRSRIYFSVQ